MKARLKKESQAVTRVSDIKEKHFAIILDGEFEGNILYRPCSDSGVFAVDLTVGRYWKRSPEITNPKVRILQAGEVIEITK